MNATLDLVAVEELPSWSPWPARLLGLEPWTTPRRDVAHVAREYDGDKYARALRYHEQTGASPAEVQDHEIGWTGDICISRHGSLYRCSAGTYHAMFDRLIGDVIQAHLGDISAVVELGAGFGYNLTHLAERFPGVRFVGGDLSPHAVTLARRLGVEAYEFDFHDTRWEPVDVVDGPVLVLTVHAVEQLPSARPFVDGVRRHGNVAKVVNLEPVLDGGDGLLSMLRRRYVEANDYNHDLLDLIPEGSVIEVDAVGGNPLNPTTVMAWTP